MHMYVKIKMSLRTFIKDLQYSFKLGHFLFSRAYSTQLTNSLDISANETRYNLMLHVFCYKILPKRPRYDKIAEDRLRSSTIYYDFARDLICLSYYTCS